MSPLGRPMGSDLNAQDRGAIADPAVVSTTSDAGATVLLASTTMDLAGLLLPLFEVHRPAVRVRTLDDVGDPSEVDVLLCWDPPAGLLPRLDRLALIQSLGAGVDHLVGRIGELDRPVPVCRVIDPHLGQSMAAYVTWAVLHRQRQFDTYLAQAAREEWRKYPVQPLAEHCVGIAGMGSIGSAVARVLRAHGFAVRGWSRRPREPGEDGITSYHGEQGLDAFLEGCDTLVCLLPLTEATRGFLGRRVFDRLPRHAHVINVARGEHVVEDELLAALDAGRLGAATLDGASIEPLPPGAALWRHPKVLVTPHIAARTPYAVTLRQMLDNLARLRRGERPATLVDWSQGY